MNWVGGARNRLKLKHENKLQKEFFERKRQQKSNARTALPKRTGKMKGRGSQDLFSLEVIMSAHKNSQKRERTCSTQNSCKVSNEKSGKQDLPAKQLQHFIPELSPIRQRPPAYFEQEKHGNFCLDHDKRKCIFSSAALGRRDDDALTSRHQFTSDEEDMGPWDTTFELGANHKPE